MGAIRNPVFFEPYHPAEPSSQADNIDTLKNRPARRIKRNLPKLHLNTSKAVLNLDLRDRIYEVNPECIHHDVPDREETKHRIQIPSKQITMWPKLAETVLLSATISVLLVELSGARLVHDKFLEFLRTAFATSAMLILSGEIRGHCLRRRRELLSLGSSSHHPDLSAHHRWRTAVKALAIGISMFDYFAFPNSGWVPREQRFWKSMPLLASAVLSLYLRD
jgi:hypothetical protein